LLATSIGPRILISTYSPPNARVYRAVYRCVTVSATAGVQRESTACTEWATTEEGDMKRWLLAGLATAALVGVTGGTAATSKPYIGKWKAQVTADQLLDEGVVDPRAPGTWAHPHEVGQVPDPQRRNTWSR
jgi:hypothetical protein